MGKQKVAMETKERASVSRERRLALALRAVLDQGVHDSTEYGSAEADAQAVLNELGYADLVGVPKRLAALEAELATATEAKDYARVAKLGLELDRVKAGKVARVVEGVKDE